MQSSALQAYNPLRSVASWTAAPPTAGPTSAPRRRWLTGLRVRAVAAIALTSFLLGVTAARAHDHYVRLGECRRWQQNVNRWAQVVADAPGELRPVETMALTLAHGAMTAVRNQMCGY